MSAQHNLALLAGHALGEAYDFSIHQKLLDLGGGTAAMSLGICQTYTKLSVFIFDLPTIAEVAREFVRESEFADRIEVQTGNFKEDELPTEFDVVLLANLLSTASEETNRELLRKLYRRLPYGGAVIRGSWMTLAPARLFLCCFASRISTGKHRTSNALLQPTGHGWKRRASVRLSARSIALRPV